MSDCDHSFSGDDICNSCGYSIGYLLINAEQEIAALKAELARAPVKVGYVKKSDAKYMPQINQEMVLIVKGLGLLCPENGYQPIYIDPPECNASHKGEEG